MKFTWVDKPADGRMTDVIRITEPEDPAALRHAYRRQRTLCGHPVPVAEYATHHRGSADRITCHTCQLILAASPHYSGS